MKSLTMPVTESLTLDGSQRTAPRSSQVVRLEDVARLAGVSKSTAAHVCRGEGRISSRTREAVLNAARELNYQPNLAAQRLSRGKSMDLVGIVCPALSARTTMMKNLAVQRALSQHNFEVPLYCFDNIGFSENAAFETVSRLCRQQPRAIYCSSIKPSGELSDELRRYQNAGGIVICGDDVVDFDCDNIVFDREWSSYEAARYLLQLGHRKLGFYEVDVVAKECEQIPLNSSASARYRGFQRALLEYDVQTCAQWNFKGNDHEESGAGLASKFLSTKDRPTAICIVNEHVASAFENEVIRAGLQVPGDISIVSHDDMPAAQYAMVPLTTISQPVEQIAMRTTQTLISRLAGSYTGASRQILIKGQLVVRESAAPPQ